MKDTKTKSMTGRKWQICLALAALTPALAIVVAVGAVLWLGSDNVQSKSLSNSNRQYSHLVMVAKFECLSKKSKAFDAVLNADKVSLVQQQGALAVTQVAQGLGPKLWPASGSYDDVYRGLNFYSGDYFGREFDESLNLAFPRIPPPFSIINELLCRSLLQGRQFCKNFIEWLDSTTNISRECIQEK